MNTKNITNSILKKYNIKANKGYGQNFLIDDNVLEGIVDSADISKEDIIVEIGPGLGNLTEYLLKKSKKVIAFEIDTRMIEILNERFKKYDNFELINQDILRVNLDSYIYGMVSKIPNYNGKIKVVANLPYYITTPIIFSLFETATTIDEIVIMVQKEVANRIVADPGSKDYGALSIMCQYYSNTKIAIDVPKECFNPMPNVSSAVVKLVKTEKYVSENNKQFRELIKCAFSQRRKKVVNSLVNMNYLNLSKDQIKQGLESLNIKETARAEDISLEQYVELNKYYNNKK